MFSGIASGTDTQSRCLVLMPSTPFVYPQVASRLFASFRVVEFSVCTGHRHFCSGFDSRQLHQQAAAMRPFLWASLYQQVGNRIPSLPMTAALRAKVLGQRFGDEQEKTWLVTNQKNLRGQFDDPSSVFR